jgi:predicted NBD/HSP70 family sugar kinase
MASIRWLRRAAKEAGIRGSSTVDCAKLQALAERGNGAARRLLDAYADRLAIGLANLRQLLGSDYFIIHGDAVGGGESFRILLTEATNARSLAPVRITFSELGDRATVLGGAAVVLGEMLHL